MVLMSNFFMWKYQKNMSSNDKAKFVSLKRHYTDLNNPLDFGMKDQPISYLQN